MAAAIPVVTSVAGSLVSGAMQSSAAGGAADASAAGTAAANAASQQNIDRAIAGNNTLFNDQTVANDWQKTYNIQSSKVALDQSRALTNPYSQTQGSANDQLADILGLQRSSVGTYQEQQNQLDSVNQQRQKELEVDAIQKNFGALYNGYGGGSTGASPYLGGSGARSPQGMQTGVFNPATGQSTQQPGYNGADWGVQSNPELFALVQQKAQEAGIDPRIQAVRGSPAYQAIVDKAYNEWMISQGNQNVVDNINNKGKSSTFQATPDQSVQSIMSSPEYQMIFGKQDPTKSVQDNFRDTPGYQFTKEEGSTSVNNQAAAQGQALSGNQLTALDRYNTGLADQTYQQYANRQESVYKTLVDSLSQQAGLGAQTANNNSSNIVNSNNAVMGQNTAIQGMNSSLSGQVMNNNTSALTQNASTQSGNEMQNATNQGNAQLAQGNAMASGFSGALKSIGTLFSQGGAFAPGAA